MELTSEPQTISGGAEYSSYLQKLINSGLDAGLRFNGVIPTHSGPLGIEAVKTITGNDFDGDAVLGQYYHIPPDPRCCWNSATFSLLQTHQFNGSQRQV